MTRRRVLFLHEFHRKITPLDSIPFCATINVMGKTNTHLSFAPSSQKHGFTPGEIRYALRHADMWINDFDTSRVPGHANPTLVIATIRKNRRVEIMMVTKSNGRIVVFHCMRVRDKILRQAEELLAQRHK